MERVSPMLARFAGHMRKHSNTGTCSAPCVGLLMYIRGEYGISRSSTCDASASVFGTAKKTGASPIRMAQNPGARHTPRAWTRPLPLLTYAASTNPPPTTAKKRIFGSKRRYEETVKPAALAQEQAPPAPLKYAPTYTPPQFLPNGWSPPPPAEARAGLPCAQTPFQVERAGPGQWLPVYTDVRKGRTQLVTLVRKVSGDLEVRFVVNVGVGV